LELVQQVLFTYRARFCICGALFGKYVGALPCFSTVVQLPDCLRTQSCHHRHVQLIVSIPVLPPQAGKSLTCFETNLSAVVWTLWKSGRIGCDDYRATIRGWGQPSTCTKVQVKVRIR